MNKEVKIVLYCYGDGSCSRDALKHILGDSQVQPLQLDGYNVYMYLDDKLIDTERFCCIVHAKFKYTLEQDYGKDTEYILGCIGELYGLECDYEQGKLSPEQIKECRQSLNGFLFTIRCFW